MTAGSLSRARASPTRWRRPLERLPQASRARAVEVDRLERLADPRCRIAQSVKAGEELEVLGHRQAHVESGFSGMIEMR